MSNADLIAIDVAYQVAYHDECHTMNEMPDCANRACRLAAALAAAETAVLIDPPRRTIRADMSSDGLDHWLLHVAGPAPNPGTTIRWAHE